MKKFRILYLVSGIIVISLVIIYLTNPEKEMLVTKDLPTQQKRDSSAISMMYETEAGSGEYVESKESTWPRDGYTFNENLSKCENGSNLSWDDTNKKVIMSGNTSDKCYVYFDKRLPLLADYVKSLYTSQGSNGIYKHESSLANSAGDNSYRYTGANPANYVCFGTDATTCDNDHLYRIIGVFGNQVKLIKADLATTNQLGTTEKAGEWNQSEIQSYYPNYKGKLTAIPYYYWSGSSSNQVNSWASSSLNTNALNTKFLGTFSATWQKRIATTNWKVGGNTYALIRHSNAKTAYTNEITNPVTGQTAVNNRIGLMYVSDYYYGASPIYWTYKGYDTETTDYRAATGANWMYSGVDEYTISRGSDAMDLAFNVYGSGVVSHNYVYGYRGVRPSFYLESTVTKTGGNGTQSDSYRIN